MSVAAAAQQWEAAKRAIDAEKARLDAAAEILKAHFRKTGRNEYKGRIAYSHGTRIQLDNAAVKAELGDRLPEFQRPVPYESLSLLK